jgi:hypothetical protein
MSLCIVGGGVAVQLAVAGFTLAWTHSVERTEWRENWRIDGERLVIAEARVKGSGAGIDPPPDAHVEDGFYVWRPEPVPREEVVLRRAPEVGDWTLCAAGRCAPLGEWLGNDADPVTLYVPDGAPCVSGPPPS